MKLDLAAAIVIFPLASLGGLALAGLIGDKLDKKHGWHAYDDACKAAGWSGFTVADDIWYCANVATDPPVLKRYCQAINASYSNCKDVMPWRKP